MPQSKAADVIASVPHKYATDAVEGKIVVCNAIRDQCARFLEMIEESYKRETPYVFDLDRGLKPVRFCEMFMTPTAGAHDKMKFMPWQTWVDAQAFGWIDRTTEARMVREVLELVGRGNGKTAHGAGLGAYMLTKDGERGPDVYYAANSKEQARIGYDDSCELIQASPTLSRHIKVGVRVTRPREGGGRMMPLHNDARRLDGLRPHFALKDELEAEQSFDQISQLRRPLKKRHQPMLWYTATAGYVLSGPLMYYYNFGKQILGKDPSVSARAALRFMPIIYELDADDDYEDPANWIKANPSIGYLLDIDELIDDWETSKRSPQERADFITKQLNIFVDSSEAGYVDFDTIKANRTTFDARELVGRPCWGGFDLSSTEDFTAAALLFELDDGRLAIIVHSWVPQEKVNKGNEKELDWGHLQMLGLVDIVPGRYVDYTLVLDWFKRMAGRYRIKSIGYDPFNASDLVRMMTAEGLHTTGIRQGPQSLNDPMKRLHETLLDGKITHNGDEMFEWYLSNVRLRRDFFDLEKENWMPSKRSRFKKIDGFMAVLFAFSEYRRMRPVTSSRWQKSRIIQKSLY